MLLVDAYNVLGVEGVLEGEWAGLDLPGLAALVSGSRLGGVRAVLVCDGSAPAGAVRGQVERVDVVYAGAGRDADSLIARMLEASSAARRTLVVSSDRAVRAHARRVGARHVSSEEFLSALSGRSRRATAPAMRNGLRETVPLGEGAVRAWVEEFGIGASDLMRIAGAAAAPKRAREADATAPKRAAQKGEPARVSEEVRGLMARIVPGIDPGELDMRRWVEGVTPLRGED